MPSLDLQPKAVHILAGTNDVYPGWQLSNTTNNIQTMVKKAKAHHIAVVLRLHSPTGAGSPSAKSRPKSAKVSTHRSTESMDHPIWAQQGIQVVDYHSLLAAANGVKRTFPH